jgi:archaellum component FlaF (FlaF/FlaG flagellin family)
MNPVVFAAIAISLVSLGAVSMASIASQQAVSSANLQKAILERDRLSEQINAFISAVEPSGSGKVATVKNTGPNPVTIDHCLVLSPSSGGDLRPAAARVPVVSNNTVNPGSTLDITIEGTVTGDSIKCVTSKGAVLPVKLDAVESDAAPDPNDYFDLYSISADVGIGTGPSYSTGNVLPVNRPSDPPVTIPPGTLTYHIPVEGTVTVSSVVAHYDDGTTSPIVQGPATFDPGQRIDIPVTKPIDRVEVNYAVADPNTSQQKSSSFIVRPSQVAAIMTTLLSGPAAVDMDVTQGANEGYMYMADGSRKYVGYIYSESRYASQLGYGGPGGRMRCSGSWVNITPVYQGATSGEHVSKTDLTCEDGWATVFQDPVSTINVKFKAPKPSFLLQIDYVVDVEGWTDDSDSYPSPFTAVLMVNNGQRQIQLHADITEVTEDDGLYSADHRIFETGSITLQIIGATPGQDMTIPVDLHVHGSTEVKLGCGCSSGFSGSMGIGGSPAMEINPSLSQ